MQKAFQLFLFFVRTDMKNRSALAGILLFGLCSIYSAYLMNKSLVEGQYLVTFWILSILFAGFYTIQRDDHGHAKSSQLFLYTLVSPRLYITIKSIYSGLFLALINSLQWMFLLFFFGNDWVHGQSASLILLAVIAISLALGITLSFVHGISLKTQQPGSILAILGFATLIPILFASVLLMQSIVLQTQQNADWGWLLILMMIALPFALSNVLYPYLWRD
ncbi:MAG: hypothetical protein RL521_1081 [Bacteroidota bacterium]|jgi:heme exporter protein B